MKRFHRLAAVGLFASLLAPCSPAEAATSPAQPVESFVPRLKKIRRSRPARQLAQAYRALQAGELIRARLLAQPYLKDAAFGDHALWVSARAFYLEARAKYDAESLKQAEAAADRAKALLIQITTEFPYSPWLKTQPRELAELELLKGDLAWLRDQWKLAQTFYQNGFQRLAAGSSLGFAEPDHLRHYGEACANLHTDLCDAWLERFAGFLPKRSQETTALLEHAPKLGEAKHPGGVAKGTQSYRAPDLDQDALDKALALELDGKHGDAVKALRGFQSEYPKSAFRYRARYWLAQALRRDGDQSGAQLEEAALARETPFTYYGLLATLSQGQAIDANLTTEVPLATDQDPWLYPLETARIHRAELLIAEGAPELAAADLKELRARDPVQARYLMYLAELENTVGNHPASFSLLSELIQRGYDRIYSTHVRGMIFPTPYWTEIRKAAQDVGVDPVLLISLVKQESAFETDAASSTGAFGLTQLMYGTAAEVTPSLARVKLRDPSTNLMTGARYLRQLLTRDKGNIALALASYNAGPYAAERWYRAMPAGRGMLEFIESIPFKETREYVSGILRNYYWYAKILDATAPNNLGFFWTQGAVTPEPTHEPSLALPNEEETIAAPAPMSSPAAPNPPASPAPAP